MLHFDSDYMEGACPQIMERLLETNMEQTPGYTFDRWSESAREKIRKACGCPDAKVHFMVGGTQTNKVVIASILTPCEGVVAAESGHINQHETGAVEATGHKVLPLPHTDGKLLAPVLEEYMQAYSADGGKVHLVRPGMVYISHPTELGTLYTKEELTALSDVCRRYGLPLFLDGARLGYGLVAEGTDVTLEDIASLCDVFYIGGTKVGALFGEAVVVTRPGLARDLAPIMKSSGALLAKGRLLGIQFDTLFTDGLYLEVSRNAARMAEMLAEGFRSKGYRFLTEPQTNQLFVILDDDAMARLKKHATFTFWEKTDASHTAVRFATSWATREEDVRALISLL